jgi:hypothetical protein
MAYFTEDQLPTGMLLVVGRSDDGRELATVIDMDRPEMWELWIGAFVKVLEDIKSRQRVH